VADKPHEQGHDRHSHLFKYDFGVSYNTIMGLTKMIEHILVGILGSMDATVHNAKHDKRKNMKPGQREE
jgi:hypothetical protein